MAGPAIPIMQQMAAPATPLLQQMWRAIPGYLGGMTRAAAWNYVMPDRALEQAAGGRRPRPQQSVSPPQQGVSPFDALDRHLGVRAYAPRPLTIRGAAPDSSYDTGDAGGILETTTPDMNRGAGAPRAGATGAGAPRAGATGAYAPLPPPRPSEEEIKKLIAMQAYANNYQSNSLPVLNEGKINWGTDAAGYDGGDSYGGNAADFFRADALRRAVPGLLGM